MSTFSKKYSTPDDSNNFIYLTWDSGYSNLKVYSNGRLITSTTTYKELQDGLYHEDEELGVLKLKFSNSNTRTLDVSVDGTTYYAEKAPVNKAALAGASGIFWMLFGFSILGTIFVSASLGFEFDNTIVLIQFISDVVIITIYAVSAIYTSKGAGWAYILGTATFIIMTVLTALTYHLMGWGAILTATIAVRMIFIGFLLTFVKRAIVALRIPKDVADDELLDGN